MKGAALLAIILLACMVLLFASVKKEQEAAMRDFKTKIETAKRGGSCNAGTLSARYIQPGKNVPAGTDPMFVIFDRAFSPQEYTQLRFDVIGGDIVVRLPNLPAIGYCPASPSIQEMYLK